MLYVVNNATHSNIKGRVTTFLENLESQRIFLSPGKQAKSGKSQRNHDRAILSAFIINSNFTSKSTLNAHFCIQVFKKFSGITPRTPLLVDGHFPRPHPSHCFTARPRRYAPRLKAFSISFVHSRPYWQSQGEVMEFHLI